MVRRQKTETAAADFSNPPAPWPNPQSGSRLPPPSYISPLSSFLPRVAEGLPYEHCGMGQKETSRKAEVGWRLRGKLMEAHRYFRNHWVECNVFRSPSGIQP